MGYCTAQILCRRTTVDISYVSCAGQQHICPELPTAGCQQTQVMSTPPERQWGCECQSLQGFRASRTMDRASSRVCMGKHSAWQQRSAVLNMLKYCRSALLVLAMPTKCGLHGHRVSTGLVILTPGNLSQPVLLRQVSAGVRLDLTGYAQLQQPTTQSCKPNQRVHASTERHMQQ